MSRTLPMAAALLALPHLLALASARHAPVVVEEIDAESRRAVSCLAPRTRIASLERIDLKSPRIREARL